MYDVIIKQNVSIDHECAAKIVVEVLKKDYTAIAQYPTHTQYDKQLLDALKIVLKDYMTIEEHIHFFKRKLDDKAQV